MDSAGDGRRKLSQVPPDAGRGAAVPEIDIAPAEFQAWYSTAFPYGLNDGAVWVGRGLTTAVSTGASARWGPVELTLAPTAFWAENRSFPLMPTGDTLLPFGDPLYPGDIDRPQRFGTGPTRRTFNTSLPLNADSVEARR